ncbi:hypothetical protein GCM10009738_13730 [Kitasatospora viridis]
MVAELKGHAVVLLGVWAYSAQVRAGPLPAATSPSLAPKAFSIPVMRGVTGGLGRDRHGRGDGRFEGTLTELGMGEADGGDRVGSPARRGCWTSWPAWAATASG